MRRAFASRLWLAIAGLCIFIAIAPLLAPNDPNGFSLPLRLQGISWQFPLGTDHMGRCVLSRLLYGFHVTPMAAFLIVVISVGIGCTLGLLSGYSGGFVDQGIMRLVDGIFVFPAIAIALTISAVLGLGMNAIIIALGAVHWAEYARITRNMAATEKQRTYIQAAKSIGTSPPRIMYRHILPNVVHVILVLIPFSMSGAILTFSGLSYLGLGAAPGSTEWGLMIAEGRVHMRDHPLLVAAPGLLIVVVVITLNMLGDRLRDHFNKIQPQQS